MDNNKILDLSKLNDETFAELRDEINRWIDSGMTTSVGFLSEEDTKAIVESYTKVYRRGAIEGTCAFVLGFAASYSLCCLIEKAVEHYRNKKTVEKID